MVASTTLRIDAEIQSLIPRPTEAELESLEASIAADGCRDALVAWRHNGSALLLDGHNRREICQRLNVAFQVSEIDLPDRDAAIAWVLGHQLARRNLSPEQMSYLRGELYRRTKKPHGGDRTASGQNVHLLGDSPQPPATPGLTAAAVGSETGVNEKTVRRDAQFADAVDTLAEAAGDSAPEVRSAILSRGRATKAAVKRAAKLPAEKRSKVAEKLAAGETADAALAAVVDPLETAEAGAAPTDGAGQQVPPKLRPAFAHRPAFRKVVAQLGLLQSQCRELAASEAGAFLGERLRAILTHLENAQREVKFCSPHAVCPYCNGRGCREQTGQKQPCRGTGWVVRGTPAPEKVR